MRTRLTSIFVLGATLAVACAGIAGAYEPMTIVPLGEPLLELNGGFKPTKLPRSKLAPIHLEISGQVNTLAGSHPPALREVVLETDKNVAVNAKGLAVCRPRMPEETAAEWVLQPCRPAQVGKGEMEVEVEFAEQTPFIMKSHVLAFNAGVKAGATTILMYAYLKSPVSAAVVTTVKVSKVRSGRYGTRWAATIPVIAGGSGSVKNFELELFRMFSHKGKRRSYLLAKCPNGKLQTAWNATFADGSGFAGQFVRPCTPRR